jgi:hypothetical protein
MPKVSHIRSPVLAAIVHELRYAPAEALLRCAARIEALAQNIEPEQQYPGEFVVFRVTGHRPEAMGPGVEALTLGAELLRDLSALCESLSERAEWPIAEARAEGFVGVADLMARWNVSRKSVERRRREGLIARRARDDRGRASLVFSPAIVEWFAARDSAALQAAASFTRMDAVDHQRLIRRARRYRARFGCSLNQVARRLAKRFDRSHEGVRLVLQRHDAANPERAIFDDHGSMESSQRRAMFRAAQRGLDPTWLARRTGRTPASVRRAIHVEQAQQFQRLVELRLLLAPTAPTFSRDDAAEVFLEPEPVRSELGTPGHTDLATMLEWARARTVPIGAVELARCRAACFLLWRASESINGLSRGNPSAAALDEIRTDLLWVARLHAEVVRSYWPVAIETLETRVGGRLEALGVAGCVQAIGEVALAMGQGVQRFDPLKGADSGGRVAGAISQSLAAVAARISKRGEPASARAAPRFMPGTAIADWTRHLHPWQSAVELPEPWAGLVVSRGPLPILVARLGLDGKPPRTLAEASKEFNTGPTILARREREELRRLRGLPNPPKSRA